MPLFIDGITFGRVPINAQFWSAKLQTVCMLFEILSFPLCKFKSFAIFFYLFIFSLVFRIKLATWLKVLCVTVRSCLYEACLLYVKLQIACVVDTLIFGALINESFLSKVCENWMRIHSGGVKQLSVKRIWQTGPCNLVFWLGGFMCALFNIFCFNL